jgi:hypothetical protein
MKLKSLGLLAITSLIIAGCFHTGEDSAEGVFTGSLNDLLARGTSVQCTWETETEQGRMTGTSYVAGERLRTESTISDVDGSVSNFYAIVDQEYVYSWTSVSDMGTKMKKEVGEDFVSDTDSEEMAPLENQPFDDQINFNCSSWTVREEMFVPPTNIQFQDFSEMMKLVPPPSAVESSLPCQICAEMPAGEVKEQCLSSCQ